MTDINDNLLTRRDRQRVATRLRVFETAVAEFRRVGCTDAQIDAIARAAGVARGTFYFHFPSKEHVLLVLEQMLENQVAAQLMGLRNSRPSLRTILATVVEGILKVEAQVGDERLLRDILAIYVRRFPEPERAEQTFPLVVEIEHQLAGAAERGLLRPGLPPDQLTVTFLTSVFGVLLTKTDERREALEGLVDVFLSGIASDPAPPEGKPK